MNWPYVNDSVNSAVASAEAPAPMNSRETRSAVVSPRSVVIAPLRNGIVTSTRMACSMNTIIPALISSVRGDRKIASVPHMAAAAATSTNPGNDRQ